MRKLNAFLVFFLVSSIAISQTELLNEDLRGGLLPTDWAQTDVVFSSYARIESVTGNLTTLTIDASAHTSVRVDLNIAKWGIGTDGPLLIEYSIDDGVNWLSAGNSVTPTSSTYLSDMITINAVSNIMKIRFNNTSSSRKRLRDVIIYGIGTATCTSPTTQASTFSATSIASENATINWVRGDGDNVLILMKESSAIDTNPTDGTAYTANSTFSSGDELGTGNYVVYNGAATTESITGLSENTTYHIAIYEYNNTDTCYNLTALIGNFTTLTNTRVQFTSVSASVSEGIGTYNLEFSISDEDTTTDTTFDVALTVGDPADINTYTTQSVTFLANTNTNQNVIVTVTDDAIFETDETLTFTIQSVAGGNNATVGTTSTFDLTITNNDIAPPITLPYSEDFSNCGTAAWTPYDEAGDDSWTCSAHEYSINGFGGTDDLDWLISDFTIDFDTYSSVDIEIRTQERYGNTINEIGEFELRYSTDYIGSGDPTVATWTTLTFNPNNTSSDATLPTATTTTVDASSITGIAYLAFFYDMTVSAGPNPEEWRILDISIFEPTDPDTEAYKINTQVSGATIIAADVTTSGTAKDALGFIIEDQGTADGLPTNITTMRFVPGANNTADWSDHIQGITIIDENLNTYTPTVSITDTEIVLTFGTAISVTDNSSLEFLLGFYLNTTNIVDNSIIQLQIDSTSSGFITEATGSTFIDPFTLGDIISNNFIINVDSTQLIFSQQPPLTTEIGSVMTDVIIQAQDDNGNVDTDYNLDINITSTGTLTSSPITETAINGIATFSSITHNTAGTNLILTADDTVFPTVNSNLFDIPAITVCALTLDFETAGGYTTSIIEFTDGDDDYFIRTNDTDLDSGNEFTGEEGSFFATQDIDGEGATLPVFLDITSINITDLIDLEFSIDLAEDDDSANQDWDDADYVRITYSIDGGTFENLIWIAGSAVNTAPLLDTDFDGIGDGTEITDTFATFTQSILSTGSSMDIKIEFNLNSGDEDIAIDNIKVCGNSTATTYTYNGTWSPSDPNGTSTSSENIVITSGNATISSNTDINTVTVNPGAGLTINSSITLTINDNITLESTSTSYSSLIYDGTIVGTINYERFANANSNGNDLITPPLTGQSWSAFLSSNTNAADLLDNGLTSPTTYAFGPFDKTMDNYVNYTDATSATLVSGTGYRVGTDSGTTLTFTGSVQSGTTSINIISNGASYAAWNLIGNPYPSYIDIQAFLEHEVDTGVMNIDIMEDASGIYGHDGDVSNGWNVITLANDDGRFMTPGQGFFVAADPADIAAYDIEFTSTMRATNTGDDFITSRNANILTYLKLKINTTTKDYNTEMYFNSNSSKGFDAGYDASIWAGNPPNFALYSHLIEDNTGLPIALQSLHLDDLTNATIPLGVNANQGEQLTFSISESSLPNNTEIYLEDNVTNTSTLLNSADYTLTPSTNLNGTGRFYLRVTNNTLSTPQNVLDNIDIYNNKNDKTIIISGQLLETTTAVIYDIQGRIVNTLELLTSSRSQSIDVSQLSLGVYIVQLHNTTQNKTQKVILK